MTDQPGWSAPGQHGPPSQGPGPGQGSPQPGYGASEPAYGAPQPPYGAPQQRYGGPPPPGYAQPSPGYGAPPPGFGQPPAGWGPPMPGPPPPPKPGVIPLRPLGIGEILDGSISTMRAHPKSMLGLSLVVALAVQLITLPVIWLMLRDSEVSFSLDPADQPTPEDQWALMADGYLANALQLLVTLIAVLFLTGVLTAIVSRAVLGDSLTVGEAWREARPRLKPLFGVTFLILLMLVVIAAVTLGPAIIAAAFGAPIAIDVLLVTLGGAACFVAVVYLYVTFALAPSVVVLERQGVVASLRRSRALLAGAWWRTFAILLLIFVISYFINLVLGIPFILGGMLAAFLAGDGDGFKMYAALPLLITGIGTILTSAITWPFTATGTVLLYVDRRIRREGLDLELARAAKVEPAARTYPG